MAGELLNNRYRIQEEVGSGGMATVYRGYCTYLERTVAVKMLKPDFAGDALFLERFKREAKAAARLSHPNIVSIFDFGEDQGQRFIVMEYVEGSDLKTVIQEHGPLTEEQALPWFEQILKALAHAHEHGVIHRDVKPQNIMIDQNGTVKVTDFGLARAVTHATLVETQQVIGSAHYIAPEQAQGNHTSAQTDLYAAGTVFYECLTGQPPFDGDSPISVAVQHIQADVPLPSRFGPVPSGLEQIVLQAMAKDPAQRYPSAESMLNDLKRYQKGDALEARVPVSDNGKTKILPAVGAPAAREQPVETGAPVEAETQGGTNGGEASPSNRLRRSWLVVILLLAVLGSTIYGAMRVYAWIKPPPSAAVPAVVGMELERARDLIETEGFSVGSVDRQFSQTAAEGMVLSQIPEPGEEIRTTRPVDLVVSRGVEYVEIPEVAGEPQRNARLILTDERFDVRMVEVSSNRYQAGTVVGTIPAAGEELPRGESVVLQVSTGPEPYPTVIPDVQGRTLTEAEAALEEKGLEVADRQYQEGIYPKDHVLKQNPLPGSEVMSGSGVDLVISRGCVKYRTERSLTLPVTDDYPEGSQVNVRMVLREGRGSDMKTRDVFHENNLTTGTQVPVTVCWQDQPATLSIYYVGSGAGTPRELVHRERLVPSDRLTLLDPGVSARLW